MRDGNEGVVADVKEACATRDLTHNSCTQLVQNADSVYQGRVQQHAVAKLNMHADMPYSCSR